MGGSQDVPSEESHGLSQLPVGPTVLLVQVGSQPAPAVARMQNPAALPGDTS